MRYSVVKVSKIYQEVREICRKYPECRSFDEARIKNDLNSSSDWDLTKKEEKAIRRMCDWLGV